MTSSAFAGERNRGRPGGQPGTRRGRALVSARLLHLLPVATPVGRLPSAQAHAIKGRCRCHPRPFGARRCPCRRCARCGGSRCCAPHAACGGSLDRAWSSCLLPTGDGHTVHQAEGLRCRACTPPACTASELKASPAGQALGSGTRCISTAPRARREDETLPSVPIDRRKARG